MVKPPGFLFPALLLTLILARHLKGCPCSSQPIIVLLGSRICSGNEHAACEGPRCQHIDTRVSYLVVKNKGMGLGVESHREAVLEGGQGSDPNGVEEGDI